MGEKYLIDSNAVIDFCNGKLPNKGRELLFSIEQPNISVITQIEILGFSDISKEEENTLKNFTSIAHIFPLNQKIALKTIELRKEIAIKLPDAVIATTAIVQNYTLITRNIEDFKQIDNLKVVNPWFLA